MAKDMEERLDLAIADLCNKAVYNTDAELLCWAFALPLQANNERWLPVDICSIISKEFSKASAYKPVMNKDYPGTKYILAPDVAVVKFDRHFYYPARSVGISQADYLHITFSLIDKELHPVGYSKNILVDGELSVGFDRDIDDRHWVYAGGFRIDLVEGGEAADMVSLQILNLKYEFPGIWFNEPLSESLFNKVCNACMEFGESAVTITRYRDRSMSISHPTAFTIIIRKTNGTFAFEYIFIYEQPYSINYEKLQSAFIDLLGDYF